MLGLALLLLLGLLTLLFTPLLPQRSRGGSGSGFPFVTIGLVGLNVLVFFLAQPQEPGAWGLSPDGGSWLSLLAYAFVHSDLLHLLGNVLTLYIIGIHVEEALGRRAFLAAFLSAAVVAGLAHLVTLRLFSSESAAAPLVGASGAIFGLLGLFAVRFWRTRVVFLGSVLLSAATAVGAVMVLQLFLAIRSFHFGDSQQVAYVTHLAGFLYGVALAFPLRVLEKSARAYGREDAEVALAQGDLSAAARLYRELFVHSPQDATLAHTLALISVRLGQEEAAHRYFLQALELLSRQSNAPAVARVFQDAQASLLHFSLPSRLLLRIAALCEEVEQFPLAQQVLSSLCRDFSHTADAELGLLKLGKLHLVRLNQPGNAAAIFTEFLRLYPDSEWAHHVRSLLVEASNQHAH